MRNHLLPTLGSLSWEESTTTAYLLNPSHHKGQVCVWVGCLFACLFACLWFCLFVCGFWFCFVSGSPVWILFFHKND